MGSAMTTAWLVCVAFALMGRATSSHVVGVLDGLGKEQATAVAELKQLRATHGAKGMGFKRSHLATAMRHGMWDLVAELLDIASEAGMNLESDFQMESSRMQRRVSQLKAALKRPVKHKRSIVPATRWAQSAKDLYLWVKFAHKLDTPAMTDIKGGKADIGARRVTFSATNAQKRFSLELELLRDIVPEHSSGCTSGSAGTCTFVLRKADINATWPRLLKSREKPKNMHVWFEMKEQHQQGLEEGQRWLDDAPERARREREERDRAEEAARQQEQQEQARQAAAEQQENATAAAEQPAAAAGAEKPLSPSEMEEL